VIAAPLGMLAGAALLAVMGAAPALAATDLADYLRDADDSVYSGRKIVIAVWDGDAAYALLDIEHAMGVTLVDRYGDDAVVGGGKLKSSSGDGALQFVDWTEEALSSRYTVREAERITHAGRQAVVVDVLEGDTVRARFAFDEETHAPLITEVFDGSGRLFRYSSMVEFAVGTAGMPGPGGDETPYDVAIPVDEHDLPAEAGPYRFVDAYGGPDDTIQGFYSDGLFSFSLFEIHGRADIEEMADGTPFTANDSEYRIVVAPTESWVLWNSGSSTYVLVGDLPPDHMEQVLVDLPEPTHRNWLQRIWHNLFD
jgi:hypothetical protein